MSEQLPPDWAIKSSCERSGHPDDHWAWAKAQPAQNPTIIAFARYIAEHEDPPVDPLLIEAREIWARECGEYGNNGFKALYRSGHCDNDPAIKTVLAGLRRGIEIGKGQQ